MAYNIVTNVGTYYSDELYHYGIKGQKWGVRNYQNPDGTLTAAGKLRYYGSSDYQAAREKKSLGKMENAKTGFGRDWHNQRAAIHEYKKDARNIDKNQSFIKKVDDSRFGLYGNYAKAYNAFGNMSERAKGYRKTALGVRIADANAFNSRELSKANKRVHDAKNAREFVDAIVQKDIYRPIKTISGRETTVGKKVVDNVITSGIYGMVRDIETYYGKGGTRSQYREQARTNRENLRNR